MRWLWIAAALLLLASGTAALGGADLPPQPTAAAPSATTDVAQGEALVEGGSTYVVLEVPP